VKHSICSIYDGLKLRPVYESDLELLRTWRNDQQLTKYLTKIPHITQEMQRSWFVKNQIDTGCYTFAIERIGEVSSHENFIGSVSLYNINGDTAEFGRAIIGNDSARGKGFGFLATVLLLNLGFSYFGLRKITASVHEDNISAIKAYEKAGFTVCGKHAHPSGGCELEIAVEKAEFYDKIGFLRQIIIHNPATVDDVKLLQFQNFGNALGNLVVIDGNDGQPDRNLPFEIKRIFYIYGTPADVTRGQHANRFSEFCFINICGTTKVNVADTSGQNKTFVLNSPQEGLYIPKMLWKDMYDFSENSVLLVLSDKYYNAAEYIRNFDEFLGAKNVL